MDVLNAISSIMDFFAVNATNFIVMIATLMIIFAIPVWKCIVPIVSSSNRSKEEEQSNVKHANRGGKKISLRVLFVLDAAVQGVMQIFVRDATKDGVNSVQHLLAKSVAKWNVKIAIEWRFAKVVMERFVWIVNTNATINMYAHV
mmetsp:Transcript_15991/g.24574  ORF Transcript_15991/g.24574 Transcript_15991/m.24574 type:complete len:145 (+) Transcript_15991:215-649(+)